MNRKLLFGTLTAFVLLFIACASTGSGTGLSLMDAIEQTAEKIAAELPKRSRVAIAAFESSNVNLSDYLMEELTGALIDRGIEVADRQNLEYVYKELNLQMSGDVSDESAKSIGKFLGASTVITGQLIDISGVYRYRTSAVSVEEAARNSVTRLNVRNDKETQRMVTAIAKQQTAVKSAKYGVSENKAPDTAGTFLDRGILLASQGEFAMAIEDFTQALKLNPNLSSAYIMRGRAKFASVAEVLSIGENFEGVGTNLNTSRQLKKEEQQVYEQAIADFTEAIRLDGNNAKTYRERGDAYADKRDYDKAIVDYNQAIRLNPRNSGAYISRGIVYAEKGDLDKAISDYNQAIRIEPNSSIPYNNRGNTYVSKGDYDKAIADFSQAIKLDPNYFHAYDGRGKAYNSKGDYDRAISDFNQAIRIAPNFKDAYGNRGYAYLYKGDYDKAIADYTQVIRLDPNNTYAYNDRGNAYYNKGDYDKAIADYTQAIKLDPNNKYAYANRGNANYEKGDYDKAFADYTQAIKLDSNYAYAYARRGDVYLEKRDYDKAIADYNQAIKLDPNNSTYKQWLEEARQKRGR